MRHILWGTKSIAEGGTGGGFWLPQCQKFYNVKFLEGQWLQWFFKCPGGGVGGGGGVAIISVSSSGHSELGFVHDFRKFSLKSSSIFLQTLLT